MMQMKPAARRGLGRTVIAMVVFLGSFVAAKYLIGGGLVSGPLAYILALIPGLAVAGSFYTSGLMIVETTDEFMRMLAVRQNLIASGFAMSVAAVWGFLEVFELVPHVEAFYIVVLWAIGVFVGMVVTRITHGVWGQCP